MKNFISLSVFAILVALTMPSLTSAQNCGCSGYPTTGVTYGYAPTYMQPVYSQPVYSQPTYAQPMTIAQPMSNFAPTFSPIQGQPLTQTFSALNMNRTNMMSPMLASSLPNTGICMQPCYNNCLADGRSQSECRNLCCQVMTMSVMAAPDGSDGICMQPCYNNCLADGNSQSVCRGLCCQGTVTFERIDFTATPEPVDQ